MGKSQNHDATAELLKQSDERQASKTNGNGPWTVVYDSWYEAGDKNGGRFAAFGAPSRRDRVMQSATWDLSVGSGLPGFSQHSEDGKWVSTYHRNVDGPDLEPIVIYQEMYGVAPDAYLISEEFRLLMHLWEDKSTGNFYSVNDDGSRELAIEFVGKQIRIRTPLLRRYQAARQLDLLLFTDSVKYVDPDEKSEAFEDLKEDDHVEDDSVVFVGVGDGFSRDQVFSRLLFKRILPPPPQEKCGIWPWDDVDEEYPEFIIDEDEDGRPVKFTCEEDKLANYFGKNPDSPHYLTPVFFKPEVLKRYYDDPALYTVSDGRLSCGNLWGVQIDNGNPAAVMVFLGDIGRDIPSSHRDHWRSYNISPVAKMSESTFRRSFLAQFAETENPEHIFKNAYLAIQKTWIEQWGWSLYREAEGNDTELIQRVRIPLNDTDSEFEAQLLGLAKLLIDLMNESSIAAGLPSVKGEKGISKFKRFLEAKNYNYVDRDIALLRRIQNLRSRIAAHTSGSDGQAFLADELGGLSKPKFIEQLMCDATQMFADLSELSPE